MNKKECLSNIAMNHEQYHGYVRPAGASAEEERVKLKWQQCGAPAGG